MFSLCLNSTHALHRHLGNIGSSFFRHFARLFHPFSVELPNPMTYVVKTLPGVFHQPHRTVMSNELSCSMTVRLLQTITKATKNYPFLLLTVDHWHRLWFTVPLHCVLLQRDISEIFYDDWKEFGKGFHGCLTISR